MGIKEALLELIGRDQPDITSVICTVDDVDMSALTCTLTPVGRKDKYYHARLSASESVNQSVVIIPQKGTYVIAALINQNDVYVAMIEKAEKIMLRGSDFGGLVKVEALVNRLNAIENALNKLLNEYKLHVHGGVTAGNVSTLIMTPVSTQTLITETQRNSLENTEVTHG